MTAFSYIIAEMQDHYEHSVPANNASNSKRKVLVFRHGLARCYIDNGSKASSDPAIPRKRQLSHSLRTSYDKKYPIRVFRSSKSRKYAPRTDKKGATRYRYDGLYGVLDYCIVDDCFQGEEYFMFFFFAWTNCQVQSISDVINKEEAKNEKDSSLCERKSKLDDTKDNGDNFEFETALTLYDLNKDSVSNLTNPDMVRELSEGFGVQLEQTAS